MRRSLAVFALLTLSAFARTEVPVAPLTFGPVQTDYAPAIASDGVQSFAVWNDSRDRAVQAIYGARLDANGALLDPLGVRLFEGIGSPAIAYGDGRYLVIDAATHYAIVDREAKVVARGWLSDGPVGDVRVVFNGRDFVVLWGYDMVNVTIVNRDGHASTPTLLIPPHFDVRLHAAATNGSRIVVLYTRGVELRAALTSATGAPITDEAIGQNVFPQVTASIATSVSGFVAAWQSIAGPDVVAAQLDANGAIVRGPIVLAANATSPQVIGDRLYATEGGALFRRIVVRTIASDLTAGPPSTVYQSQFLSVLWFTADERHVVAHLFHPNRSVVEEGLYVVQGAPKLVSRAADAQVEPRIASGGNGTMIAWREKQALWATFLPRAGAPNTFHVDGGFIESHAIAALGDTYLLAWATFEEVRVWFYREHEQLADPVTLDTIIGSVAAASDGEGFVVAWSTGNEIRLVRFTTDGDVAATYEFPYGNVTDYAAIALACDDGECLIVWRNQTMTQTCPRLGCVTVDARVMALRLDASLTPIDDAPVVLAQNLPATSEIVAAARKGEYAVSWVALGMTYARTLASDDTLVLPGEHPSLAREDDGWLLVREVAGELVARRLREAGAPYEFTLFRDAQARSAPALARGGAITVAAYERTTRGEAAGGVPRIHITTIDAPKTKRRAISR